MIIGSIGLRLYVTLGVSDPSGTLLSKNQIAILPAPHDLDFGGVS